jgi:hypothetical protein
MPPKKVNRMKNPIPEDFELSDDDEPKMISLSKEQKLTSKSITFDFPHCFTKLQLQNEIEINPKGIKCSCNPCSFKITKNDKTMNVSKDDDGGITLDSQDHSISFSWNRQITPEDQKVESTNRMITDVMKTQQSAVWSQDKTPRNSGRKITLNNMD